jgi:hypothetical protein
MNTSVSLICPFNSIMKNLSMPFVEQLRGDGYRISHRIRAEGYGIYYECVIFDPDDNRIEIVA